MPGYQDVDETKRNFSIHQFDEESFMEKLNGYFQSKYGKELDDHIDDDPKEGDKVDIHRVSAVDIFTMNEEDLDRVFPLNDNEIQKENAILDDASDCKSNEKSKGKRTRRGKRNRNQYRKTPTNPKPLKKAKDKAKTKNVNTNGK